MFSSSSSSSPLFLYNLKDAKISASGASRPFFLWNKQIFNRAFGYIHWTIFYFLILGKNLSYWLQQQAIGFLFIPVRIKEIFIFPVQSLWESYNFSAYVKSSGLTYSKLQSSNQNINVMTLWSYTVSYNICEVTLPQI